MFSKINTKKILSLAKKFCPTSTLLKITGFISTIPDAKLKGKIKPPVVNLFYFARYLVVLVKNSNYKTVRPIFGFFDKSDKKLALDFSETTEFFLPLLGLHPKISIPWQH
jgi:hypothetical protein